MLPFHAFIFTGMLRGIRQQAEALARGTAQAG
jgi:hypothetical protein